VARSIVRTDGFVVLLNTAYAKARVEVPGIGGAESTYDTELAKQSFASALAALPSAPTTFLFVLLRFRRVLFSIFLLPYARWRTEHRA
jgi:hypothetical protein